MSNQIQKFILQLTILAAICLLAKMNVLDNDSIKVFIGMIIGYAFAQKSDIAHDLTKKK